MNHARKETHTPISFSQVDLVETHTQYLFAKNSFKLKQYYVVLAEVDVGIRSDCNRIAKGCFKPRKFANSLNSDINTH